MQRIDNFSGSEEQYITYLESKCTTLRQSRDLILQKYQQLVRHHQNCSVPLGLPSPTKSSEDWEDQTPPLGLADISTTASSPQQTSTSLSPLQASIAATSVTNACPSLKVVEWNYGQLPRNKKRGGSTKSHNRLKPPRWQHLANNLIELTPTSDRWWQALTDAGIGSVEQVSTALEFLLQHNTSDSIFPHLPKIDSPIVSSHDELLLSYATSYANALDARNISTQLTLMLVNFSKFLFVDLCIVLEDQGVTKDSVKTMMRIVISDATDLTLDRIKRAVKWINTASDQLSARWGLRAGLLPLLCQNITTASILESSID